MLKQVEQCCGVHNIAGSNPIAAITLLSVILKQLKIAAGNVKKQSNVMALHRGFRDLLGIGAAARYHVS